MSYTVNNSVTDTAISGVTAPVLTLPVLNYDADYRLKASSTANEVVMVNTTTSLDTDESIRIAVSDITDIYKNAGISCDSIISNKQGYSLLIQLNKTVKITDSVDATYSAHVPITANLVIKIPKHEAMTNVVLQDTVKRLVSALYENGTIKALALLKGAISPKGL